MKSKYILFLFVALALASLACQSQAVDPAPAALAPQKLVQSTVTAPKTAQVCLTAETVRLRDGAGTSYNELALLNAGDMMTLLDTIAESEDGGLWSKVKIGGREGWINSRYICGSE